ncbi:unnamed protein product [Pleuronectes platessa]|uniref:Uncharacterized protein n=1 Tax=Pleuronectes platessa TaxID=8262 RepID=A0A9N7UV25_PLEPL|nr:unnamed protein product [Pleuronectes platessa]
MKRRGVLLLRETPQIFPRRKGVEAVKEEKGRGGVKWGKKKYSSSPLQLSLYIVRARERKGQHLVYSAHNTSSLSPRKRGGWVGKEGEREREEDRKLIFEVTGHSWPVSGEAPADEEAAVKQGRTHGPKDIESNVKT